MTTYDAGFYSVSEALQARLAEAEALLWRIEQSHQLHPLLPEAEAVRSFLMDVS